MNSKRRNNFHDSIVDDLEFRLHTGNVDYHVFIKERDYDTRGMHGEVDYAVLRRGKNNTVYALVFEVKSTDNLKNRVKAKKQLLKDVYYVNDTFYDVNRIFKFYVTKDSIEWIR